MRYELTVGANVRLILYYRRRSQRSRRSQPNTLKKENGRPGAAAGVPRRQAFRKALASGIPPCFGQICTECLAFYRLWGDPAVAFLEVAGIRKRSANEYPGDSAAKSFTRYRARRDRASSQTDWARCRTARAG